MAAPLPRDDDVGPGVGLSSKMVEKRLVDRVREDVGAAHHRDAEDDRERREVARSLRPSRPLSATRITAGSLPPSPRATSWAVALPSSLTISPSARKSVRSAIAVAFGSCETMTKVWPRVSTDSRSRARISWLVVESRLPVGSSAKTTVGLETSARAMATRCCWPPESSAGRCVLPVGEADALDDGVRPVLVDLAAGELEREDDVLLGREHGEEVEELEDEADVLAPELGQLGVPELRDGGAVDLDLALGRAVEAGEDVHERRLAGARRAHDGGELAALDVERDAAQRSHRGVALAVDADDVVRRDDGAVTACSDCWVCSVSMAVTLRTSWALGCDDRSSRRGRPAMR